MPPADDSSRKRPAQRGSKPPARGGKPTGRGKPTSSSGKPTSGSGKPSSRGKPSSGKPERRDGKPFSRDAKPARNSSRDGRSDSRDSRPPRDASKDRTRSTAGRWRRDELPEIERTAIQAEYDGPPLPEDITGKELDKHVQAQLKSLPEKLAARVARHLVAAAALMDSDPETAYKHTLAARARASRVAVVREASGEAAYASGHFKEALTEFKAARRMTHSPLYLPMMADCERGLGRPERALALAKDPGVADLDDDGQIEMKIVESGARRDLGDAQAAIRVLDGRELRSGSRASWVPRLRYAYAEALLADGQVDLAREWFERAAGVDTEGSTDALERLEALTDEPPEV